MFAPRGLDRVARNRAQDRARWLVRDHGADAEAVIAAKLARAGNTRADRVFYRMIARELRVLRDIQAQAEPSRPGWFARLIGVRGRTDA